MKVKIHELAVKELNEAIDWYELQSPNLGKKFKKALLEQIKKIKLNPSWFLEEIDNIYKAYMPKFPYKILYTLNENEIIVWAIAHLHRRPWYWQSRTK